MIVLALFALLTTICVIVVALVRGELSLREIVRFERAPDVLPQLLQRASLLLRAPPTASV